MNVEIPAITLSGVGIAAVIAAMAYIAMRMHGKSKNNARIDASLLFGMIGGSWAAFALLVLPKIAGN